MKRGWLRVAVTACVTVFWYAYPAVGRCWWTLIRDDQEGLATDRYPACDHLAADEHQVCQAHLRRDFQAIIDRGNAGTEVTCASTK